jgi:hypothetical protein
VRTLKVALAVVVFAVAQPARAQAPLGDACEPSDSLDFPSQSVELDLTAQAELNAAANWAQLSPGRYLLLVTPSDQVNLVRVQVAAAHLESIGFPPRLLLITGFENLAASEQHALAEPGTVVVMTCLGVPPRPAPQQAAPEP